MKKIMKFIYIFLVILLFLPVVAVVINAINLKNWLNILKDYHLYRSFLDTVYILILTLMINIIIGTPVASFLGKNNNSLKKVVEIIVILPLIIPITIITLGLQFLFIKLNLIESILGVSIVNGVITLPYYILTLKGGYESFNSRYVDLGKIYCRKNIEVFKYITFPILFPYFITGISMIIIVTLSQYILNFIIGGGQIILLPVIMFPYMVDGGSSYGAILTIVHFLYTITMLFLIKILINYIKNKMVKYDKSRY